jgi:hypothetical protein
VSVVEEERAMDASSTDKRIDDLAGQVGRFEGDVRGRFDKVDHKFDKVDHKFERLEDKIDARFARWDKIVAGGVVSIVVAVIYKVLGL